LFRFGREQSVVNINGVRFGGQPGEFPTVLCGTIFYQGHRIVQDEEQGSFDREEAEGLICRQAELSDETGNPSVLHIYARTAEAFQRYLGFAEDLWSGPFIIDSADPETRCFMARHVSEVGLADKAIFNSISLATTEMEAATVASSEVDSAIVLAYNPSDPGVEGCLKMLETGGGIREVGLIPLARRLGLVNLLLDPGVMPLGSSAGSALRFSVVAKARFGLPVGSGMHNAASSWPWLKARGLAERMCGDAAASALQILASGDFILYGPIENSRFIFPAAAMTDILVAEAVRDLEVWSVPEHPLYRLV
jgi:tetrahydromethanopterin S-methyltransferase subunit H